VGKIKCGKISCGKIKCGETGKGRLRVNRLRVNRLKLRRLKGLRSFFDAVPPYCIYELLSPPYFLIFVPIYFACSLVCRRIHLCNFCLSAN
jgi:hypothetical protein